MGLSRLWRMPTARVFVVVSAVLGMPFVFGGAVSAGEEAFGSAFAISAEGLVDIDPEPEVSFPTGGQDTTIEVDLGGLLLACTLNASSRGFDGDGDEVDNVADAEQVVSTASVETATLLGDPDADCDDGGDDVGSGELLDFLDELAEELLGGTGISVTAIASQCTADEDGVDGESSLVGLGGDDELIGDLLGDGLDLNELALDLGLDPTVDLGILELALDEQIEDPDGNGITVRALRLTLLPGDGDGEALQEVILAESRCRFVGDDDDEDDDDGNDGAGNDSDVTNESDGTAVIRTGDATAVGNSSQTEINQSASSEGSGASGGGVILVDQEAEVDNDGSAAANTGVNTAVGNDSTNVARNDQAAAVDGGRSGDAGGAESSGSVSNVSDGTAVIETGDATAVGNASATEINQEARSSGGSGGHCSDDACLQRCPKPKIDCPEECPEPEAEDDLCEADDDACDLWCGYGWGGGGSGGVSSTDQSASVSNTGSASANSGGNTAVGNSSDNTASNDQSAVALD